MISCLLFDSHNPNQVIMLLMNNLWVCLHIYRHAHSLFDCLILYVKLTINEAEFRRINLSINITILSPSTLTKREENKLLRSFNYATCSNIKWKLYFFVGIYDLGLLDLLLVIAPDFFWSFSIQVHGLSGACLKWGNYLVYMLISDVIVLDIQYCLVMIGLFWLLLNHISRVKEWLLLILRPFFRF